MILKNDIEILPKLALPLGEIWVGKNVKPKNLKCKSK